MTLRLFTLLLFGMTIFALIVLLNEALTTPIAVVSGSLVMVQWALVHKSIWVMRLTKRVNTIKNLGALIMILLIAPAGKELGLLNSMVNLLFSGTVLWLFTANFNNNSWAKQVFIGSQLLIAVAFIYQQSLAWSMFSLACVLVSLNALYISQLDADEKVFNGNLQRFLPPKFFYMTVSAMCIATLLFFAIPALKPFWKLPEQKQNATGLSDSMTPGDIASLASSSRLAFRVQVESASRSVEMHIAAHANRYWRVLTLENFNGKTWSQAEVRKRTRQRLPNLEGSRRRALDKLKDIGLFNVIAEASQQPWLLGFGTPISSSDKIITTTDSRLLHQDNIIKRTKYAFTAKSLVNDVALSNFDRQLNLALPKQGLAQTRELAERLWQQASQSASQQASQQQNSDAVVSLYNQLILNYFREQQFRYTLQPQLLNGDHVDDFLFNTQEGFCAHFASAHAVLLRLAGVPARVVTGYHGGEYNEVGDYYNIDDSSAHAWVEYSPDGAYWSRVDPTAAASPTRLEFGLEQAMQNNADAQIDAEDFVKQTPWLNRIRQQIQSLDYYWTVWVLDYDQSKRENKLRNLLSDANFWKYATALLSLIVFSFGLYWLYRMKGAKAQSPERKLIQSLYLHLHQINKLSVDEQIDWSKSIHQHKETLEMKFPRHNKEISEILNAINKAIYNKHVPIYSKAIFNDIAKIV